MGGDEFCALLRPGLQPIEPLVDGAALALSEHGEGFSVDVLLRLGAARRGGARRRPTRCGSPTSACTRASAAAAPPSAARPPTSCCARSPSATPTSAGTPATSRCWPRRRPRSLGLEPEDVEAVRQAAQLHDIGKVAIPEAILHKPGPLDDDEWAFMRRHSVIGERIIGEAPALARVAAMVRSSHERFDGTGYPDGLAGKDIPLGARIVAVCDAFDAMITERPYSAGQDARGGRARAARVRRQPVRPGRRRGVLRQPRHRGAPARRRVAALHSSSRGPRADHTEILCF